MMIESREGYETVDIDTEYMGEAELDAFDAWLDEMEAADQAARQAEMGWPS